MNKSLVDFQGIIALDHKIIDHLEKYLQEKEARLAAQILQTFHETYASDPSIPHLPPISSVKITDTIEIFSKKIRQNRLSSTQVDQLVLELNEALSNFTETLQECVNELFQQVWLVPINRWYVSIFEVVRTIKNLLLYKIENLSWAVRCLEIILKECFPSLPHKKIWEKLKFFWKTFLDSALLRHLQQIKKNLQKEYKKFHSDYQEYMRLSIQAEKKLKKMELYPLLARLDLADQNLYIDVFRLLYVLQLHQHMKNKLNQEIVHSLKNLSSIDKVILTFSIYIKESQKVFFESSLHWKFLHAEHRHFREKNNLCAMVEELRQEIQQLIQLISQYRLFVIKNSRDFYERSRWGFSEWNVSPESPKTKQLVALIYQAEELETFFTEFIASLKRDPAIQKESEHKAHQEIEKILHEMGKPLISQSALQHTAAQLVNQLKVFDEIGNPHMEVISYIEHTLSKAIHKDWRYHVLHRIPLFHQLYRIHQGLVVAVNDPSHVFRIEHFQQLFSQIQEWVDKEDVFAHIHEVEIDMNDMKSYLQDFLAIIQRTFQEKSKNPFLEDTLNKLEHQLLEYRYLFGQFFSTIMNKKLEGIQLRNQFIFVDQYFESMENVLEEIKSA